MDRCRDRASEGASAPVPRGARPLGLRGVHSAALFFFRGRFSGTAGRRKRTRHAWPQPERARGSARSPPKRSRAGGSGALALAHAPSAFGRFQRHELERVDEIRAIAQAAEQELDELLPVDVLRVVEGQRHAEPPDFALEVFAGTRQPDRDLSGDFHRLDAHGRAKGVCRRDVGIDDDAAQGQYRQHQKGEHELTAKPHLPSRPASIPLVSPSAAARPPGRRANRPSLRRPESELITPCNARTSCSLSSAR